MAKALIVSPDRPRHPPCIFCGQPANSREDAWPNWLIALLQRHSGEASFRIDFTIDGRAGRPKNRLKVRCVCVPCNTGWMSRLEKEAIPILKPLITDTSTGISSQQQLTLCRWATKCALVFDCIENRAQFFGQADSFAVWKDEQPPRSIAAIWITRCASFENITDGKTLSGFDQRGRPVKGHVHTMLIGHLIIQVLAIDWNQGELLDPAAQRTFDAVSGPWDTFCIWPLSLRRTAWPPTSYSFDDRETFFAFANRFNVGFERKATS